MLAPLKNSKELDNMATIDPGNFGSGTSFAENRTLDDEQRSVNPLLPNNILIMDTNED